MSLEMYAPMKSEKALQEMENFLKENFRLPNEFLGHSFDKSSEIISNSFPVRGTYRQLDLGFRISPILSPIDYRYMFGVVMWMASVSGQSRVLKNSEKEESIKYYRDNEDSLVPLSENFEIWRQRKPDNIPTRWMTGFNKKNLSLILEEIDRLDKLFFS